MSCHHLGHARPLPGRRSCGNAPPPLHSELWGVRAQHLACPWHLLPCQCHFLLGQDRHRVREVIPAFGPHWALMPPCRSSLQRERRPETLLTGFSERSPDDLSEQLGEKKQMRERVSRQHGNSASFLNGTPMNTVLMAECDKSSQDRDVSGSFAWIK